MFEHLLHTNVRYFLSIIIHCLEVSCKVDQITSAIYQTVIYYSTIHALELIYFDSNTQ